MTTYICDDFMDLRLAMMPVEKVRSGYNAKNQPPFPTRLGFLHPDVLLQFIAMQVCCNWKIVLTDGWRPAIVSLQKKYPPGKPANRYSQFPAFSGHNYGFSIDVDVSATLKLTGWTKQELDEFMEGFGFYCHRRDHKREVEEWHYNALVIDNQDWMQHASKTRTSPALEAMIEYEYGDFWAMSYRQRQRCLQFLNLYPGDIDGKWGPWSKTAARSFQKAWHLKPDGIVGKRTGRVLQLRCAELRNPLTASLWSVQG